MKKFAVSLFLAVSLYFLVLPQQSFALNLLGYTFSDNAFSDDAKLISGSVSYFGFSKWGYPITGDDSIDLPVAFNGGDLYTGVEGARDPNNPLLASFWTADIYFKDNYLFNGLGADLVVFERGQAAEAFNIALYDSNSNSFLEEKFYTPVFKGNLPEAIDVSREVNTAEIDFSSWGLPADFKTDRIRIISESHSQPPDIAAFGGLNSGPVVTPEPASMILFGLGGAMLFLRKK